MVALCKYDDVIQHVDDVVFDVGVRDGREGVDPVWEEDRHGPEDRLRAGDEPVREFFVRPTDERLDDAGQWEETVLHHSFRLPDLERVGETGPHHGLPLHLSFFGFEFVGPGLRDGVVANEVLTNSTKRCAFAVKACGASIENVGTPE